MRYTITGGTIVTPDDIVKNTTITIENGYIRDMGTFKPGADFNIVLDQNDIVFPALINAHDHLLGTYYPRIGSSPYLNWKAWDNDLKSDPLYVERSQISNEDLYFLGAYRNLISGVTTVADHIPHEVHQPFIPKLPVRALGDFTMQHECSSYDLKWGGVLSEEHTHAIERDVPFITHIEEGLDEEATIGIDILKELKALDEHTVLVHGIAFSKEDIKLIAKHKAHCVWCPTSNYFMFKCTTDIKELLANKVNVCLGTDSPMSGGVNMLEEFQFARSLYHQIYDDNIDEKELVKMTTVNPAKALRLKDLGSIKIGNRADFLILSNCNPNNPYRSLVNAWLNDIRYVFRDGIPMYGFRRDYEVFTHFSEKYQILEMNGEERILIGYPVDLYQRIWKNIKYKKIFPFFPIEIY